MFHVKHFGVRRPARDAALEAPAWREGGCNLFPNPCLGTNVPLKLSLPSRTLGTQTELPSKCAAKRELRERGLSLLGGSLLQMAKVSRILDHGEIILHKSLDIQG